MLLVNTQLRELWCLWIYLKLSDKMIKDILCVFSQFNHNVKSLGFFFWFCQCNERQSAHLSTKHFSFTSISIKDICNIIFFLFVIVDYYSSYSTSYSFFVILQVYFHFLTWRLLLLYFAFFLLNFVFIFLNMKIGDAAICITWLKFVFIFINMNTGGTIICIIQLNFVVIFLEHEDWWCCNMCNLIEVCLHFSRT